MKIISLGWGVQSFTLAAMSALGEIERVDYVIHADTGFEAVWTYEFAKKWTPWLIERGLKVLVAKKDNALVDKYGGLMIPAFADTGGSGGQIHRQCTGNWKIVPMRRLIQSFRNKECVEMWIGISLDEYQRMKPANVKYIKNRWPLIEMRMTRNDCANWLKRHDLEVPSKSACYFCPFHTTAEWREVKRTEDWKLAIETDEQIRKSRPPFDLYLHPSRKPLVDVDIRSAEEKGQPSLWDNECFGICGI